MSWSQVSEVVRRGRGAEVFLTWLGLQHILLHETWHFSGALGEQGKCSQTLKWGVK